MRCKANPGVFGYSFIGDSRLLSPFPFLVIHIACNAYTTRFWERLRLVAAVGTLPVAWSFDAWNDPQKRPVFGDYPSGRRLLGHTAALAVFLRVNNTTSQMMESCD